MKKTEEAFRHFVQDQVSASYYHDFFGSRGDWKIEQVIGKKTFSIVFDFLNSASVIKS